MKTIIKSFGKTLILTLVGMTTMLTSCSEKIDESNLYTFTGETIEDFLINREEEFSDFNYVLQRTGYDKILSAYGTYTCFAPTNEAIQLYLKENGFNSLNDLSRELCDTISRTHIVQDKAYFTTDMGGEVPPVNMNDDYIEMTSDSDVYNNNALLIYVNKNSRIIQKDDSVTNGVVHVVDHVIQTSNQFLPALMEENPNLSIFSQALKLTGIADSLTKYNDDTYTVDPDSAWGGKGFKVPYGTANDGTASKQCNTWYPEKRFFKFTAFVETDSIYRLHGINNLDDLIAYAKQVYDESYPDDAGKYDEDYKSRHNPLNRFVSYHLINRTGPRDYWVHCRGDIYTQKFLFNIYDPEDYYETMAPHTLIRFCSNPGE